MYTKNVSRTINTEINWYHNLFNFITDVTSFKLLKFSIFLMERSELTATKFWSIFSHSSLSRYQLSSTLHNPYFPILHHFFISNPKTHLKKTWPYGWHQDHFGEQGSGLRSYIRIKRLPAQPPQCAWLRVGTKPFFKAHRDLRVKIRKYKVIKTG